MDFNIFMFLALVGELLTTMAKQIAEKLRSGEEAISFHVVGLSFATITLEVTVVKTVTIIKEPVMMLQKGKDTSWVEYMSAEERARHIAESAEDFRHLSTEERKLLKVETKELTLISTMTRQFQIRDYKVAALCEPRPSSGAVDLSWSEEEWDIF